MQLNSEGQYEVMFTGLKPGEHLFDFEFDHLFFENSGSEDILDGRVAARVLMVKEERMMDFHFAIEGKVSVRCDRCNEPVEIPVSGEERLIVKLGDRYMEESEEVQVVPETAGKINLAPFFYEYIFLLLPARRVHPEDGRVEKQCNPEILKKLKELSENHLPDPRWEVLKKLKTDPEENTNP
ncbi:MAG TPA: DUF177 domain-containing protein [Bacteroidales bacterium]|nr:DUF177 domain-containing protein [Bacteroidales bacterium]